MVPLALSAFTSAYPLRAHRPSTAPSLHRGSVVLEISGTMGRSDSRSALTRFAGSLLIGLTVSQATPWSGAPQGSLLGRRRVSSVPTTAVPPFRALYAAGFLGAASPRASPLPWPSPQVTRLGSRLPSHEEESLDAAGFTSCCGLVACTLLRFPVEGVTPRFNVRISPNAGGLLQRWRGPSSGWTYTS